jgi:hypothetical protein
VSLMTEFEFTLPKGYVDENGNLHRNGVMRLATAADEVLSQRDPRVQANPAYLIILILSRVIVRLGPMQPVAPNVIEGLFSADFAYLQEFCNRINEIGCREIPVTCPKCHYQFSVTGTDDKSSRGRTVIASAKSRRSEDAEQ